MASKPKPNKGKSAKVSKRDRIRSSRGVPTKKVAKGMVAQGPQIPAAFAVGAASMAGAAAVPGMLNKSKAEKAKAKARKQVREAKSRPPKEPKAPRSK